MKVKLAKEFCVDSKLAYVYSIVVGEVFYFCTLNSKNSTYAFYKLEEGSISLYEKNLSLANAKFKKQILLEMGGVLGENEEEH